MKYLLALMVILAFFLVACDIPPAPGGDNDGIDSDDSTQLPNETSSDDDPQNGGDGDSEGQDDDVQQDDFTDGSLDTVEELGITTELGRVGFLNEPLNVGQWATYKITKIGTGETLEYERQYNLVSFFHNSDFCIGIERNSTVPGEIATQSMYCDRGIKRVFVWNSKYNKWDTPEVTGRNARWGDERVQGFDVTKFDGLSEVDVPAGKFFTLHKGTWDGATQKDMWHSPLVPGFEAGLVKEVITSEGITTTTELVGFSHN